MLRYTFIFSFFVIASMVSLTQSSTAGSLSGISIGTGGEHGAYFPAGKAVCTAIKHDRLNVSKCVAKLTKGSIDNIERMRSGETNFGIVQSDTLFYAVNGYGPFKGKPPFKELRTVLSLHAEQFTILARKDSGIRYLDDLKGKRVNFGPIGSGGRTTMELVMRFKGWKKDFFAEISDFSSTDITGALCAGKVDAIVLVIGHPNAALKKETKSCATILVNTYDPQTKKMIEKFPYLRPMRIPQRTYPGSPASTLTFGMKAVLVTTSKEQLPTVFNAVQSVSRGYYDFIFSHNVLQAIKRDMLAPTDAITPMHMGAAQFFQK